MFEDMTAAAIAAQGVLMAFFFHCLGWVMRLLVKLVSVG